MVWLTLLIGLIFLLGLTALISFFIFYIQFSNSLEKRWRDEVLGLFAAADQRASFEYQQLRRLESDKDAEIRSLQDEAFHAYLASIDVGELEAYQGIGPGTVEKLREGGFRNLAALRSAHIHIHGLGEKRLTDIDGAVRALLRTASKTFDDGACAGKR